MLLEQPATCSCLSNFQYWNPIKQTSERIRKITTSALIRARLQAVTNKTTLWQKIAVICTKSCLKSLSIHWTWLGEISSRVSCSSGTPLMWLLRADWRLIKKPSCSKWSNLRVAWCQLIVGMNMANLQAFRGVRWQISLMMRWPIMESNKAFSTKINNLGSGKQREIAAILMVSEIFHKKQSAAIKHRVIIKPTLIRTILSQIKSPFRDFCPYRWCSTLNYRTRKTQHPKLALYQHQLPRIKPIYKTKVCGNCHNNTVFNTIIKMHPETSLQYRSWKRQFTT